jgi:hypothetical protein
METNMTIVACKVLLGVMLTLCNVSTTVNSGGAQEKAARQNAAAPNYAPRIENARMEARRVAGTLAATMAEAEKKATSPMWIGYSVKAVEGERTICCGNYSDCRGEDCGRCELETDRDHWNNRSNKNSASTVKLEGGEQLIVLFRLQDRQLMRVKPASEHCILDAGELPFVWLEDVRAADSVAFLSGYVREEGGDGRYRQSIGNEALTAIALHEGADAEAALESFTAPAQPEELRKQAAFWLGVARGKEGLAALQRLARKDPSAEVRAHVAFALSVNKEPAALEEMIRMAHEDESGHVRGQAIFWLAQKAGKRAVSAIDGAIANDADTEVKKQAVFALSQLPEDEGVPKLIQVAENNRNPEVRKQAMFWLGQSQDPRALGFFEKVLLK